MDNSPIPLAPLSSAASVGGRQPRVQLLIVQPTPFCNIDCSYCYLTSRSSRATITDATLDNLFAKLFATGWVGRSLDLVWHAGEPTVLPIDTYRRMFAIMQRHRPRHVKVSHGFQTNATLLSKEWCAFFRDEAINVGVSIDGPQWINDAHRLNRAGKSTYAKVIDGIRLLRQENVPFHVITVLSNASLGAARELHDFYVSEGIEHVGFNVEESEGEHVSGLQPNAAAWQAYHDFLAEFWSIAARAGNIKSIREIDYALRAIYMNPKLMPGNKPPPMPGNILVEPFAILSMDHEGNLATFSPELLGQKNAEYNDFVIGNVNRDDFADLPRAPVLTRMHADITAGVALCRAECGYFDVCGGGEPINKLAENGSFASSATNFCRMTRMAVADLVTSGPYAA
jgi:uncharacterized protein